MTKRDHIINNIRHEIEVVQESYQQWLARFKAKLEEYGNVEQVLRWDSVDTVKAQYDSAMAEILLRHLDQEQDKKGPWNGTIAALRKVAAAWEDDLLLSAATCTGRSTNQLSNVVDDCSMAAKADWLRRIKSFQHAMQRAEEG